MPTITKSIGTASRDYSTITLWEADLDNTTPYDAGDDALGTPYDDSAFDEEFTWNGGGTIVLNSVTLDPVASERHRGVAGIGARIVRTTTAANVIVDLNPPSATAYYYTLSHLEINANRVALTSKGINTSTGTVGRVSQLSRLILHGGRSTAAAPVGGITASTRDLLVHNCVVYDFVTTANNRQPIGINLDGDEGAGGCYFNTVYGITGDGTGFGTGIATGNNTQRIVFNNLVGNITSTGAGAALDFLWSGSLGQVLNNMSEDTTADEIVTSDGIANQSFAAMFVSTVDGSEDFRLRPGAPAIDQGFTVTDSEFRVDVTDYDRGASGTHDIGAHEYIVRGAVGIWDLTELFFAEVGDPLAVVDDPSGTPITKKTTPTDLRTLACSNVVVQVLAGSGTYTPTAGMRKVLAIAVGGGGGGAGGINTDSTGGGGGGGGTVIRLMSAATIGSSKSYAVGAGAAPGSDGGATTLDTAGALMNAGGGLQATAGTTSTVVGTSTAGGAGGSAANGDLNIPGEPGERGIQFSGSEGRGGRGGSSFFGMGGASSNTSTAGATATGFGSGGNGGQAATATDRVGSSGTNGTLYMIEFI